MTINLPLMKTEIMKIQSLLLKSRFYTGELNGIMDQATQNAVLYFQRSFDLEPTGIIDRAFLRAIQPLLLGYYMYTIKPGDTVYGIARQNYITPAAILTANPGVKPEQLVVGHQLVVPYRFPVVDTNIDSPYQILENDIMALKVRYPFLEVSVAGISVLSRNLYCLKLGRGENKVFYNASHHGLEWITSVLLMKFTEDFLRAYSEGDLINGYDPREMWEQSTLYIMPMVNPDGVDLVLNGLQPDNPYYNELLRWNNNNPDFSQTWQANNRGVDLNHNYNAAWNLSKEAESIYGITGPGPTRYSGPAPESEPETRAVVNFTLADDFRLAIAFHSQGEVIYWNFMDMATEEAREIGENLSAISGYLLDNTAGIASYSGYKDWFIQEFRRPGYTIEVGKGRNPLPISQFDKIYRDNLGMLLYAAVV
mgnify:FL=1|jgi:g-D-glutamyl-meso-diaminopimelate peptidase